MWWRCICLTEVDVIKTSSSHPRWIWLFYGIKSKKIILWQKQYILSIIYLKLSPYIKAKGLMRNRLNNLSVNPCFPTYDRVIVWKIFTLFKLMKFGPCNIQLLFLSGMEPPTKFYMHNNADITMLSFQLHLGAN